jgi:hypothetical protein
VYKFPTASNAIFYPHNTTYTRIKLNDSTYEFGLISIKNKVFLLNSLPKVLSKEKSDSYFKRPRFFTYTDSLDLVRQDSLFEERTKWTKAPKTIDAEFLRFYELIKSDEEYLIIAPKTYINNAPW